MIFTVLLTCLMAHASQGMVLQGCKSTSKTVWPKIENGRYNHRNSVEGYYICDKGYKFTKESNQDTPYGDRYAATTCKDDVLIAPACEVDPEGCKSTSRTVWPEIENGRYNHRTSVAGFYICDIGYKFTKESNQDTPYGDRYATTTCKDDVLIAPACEVDVCNNFWYPQIENGRKRHQNSTTGFYQCDMGYKFTKESIMDGRYGATTCKDDVLIAPACEVDVCNNFWYPQIENGRKHHHNSTTGFYQCDQGYRFTKESTQVAVKWSHRDYGVTTCKDDVLIAPACEVDVCASTSKTVWPEIENGRYRHRTSVAGFYQCDRGYKFTKESNTDTYGDLYAATTCKDDVLIAPACEVDPEVDFCKIYPNAIENGQYIGLNSAHALYFCNRGFTFTEESKKTGSTGYQIGLTSCEDNALVLPVCEKSV